MLKDTFSDLATSFIYFIIFLLKGTKPLGNHQKPQRKPLGTITEAITTRETIRNKKWVPPRKCQRPNTGKEEVSKYQSYNQTTYRNHNGNHYHQGSHQEPKIGGPKKVLEPKYRKGGGLKISGICSDTLKQCVLRECGAVLVLR